MNKRRIGIIGQGFVGTAIREKLKEDFFIFAWDKTWENSKTFGKSDGLKAMANNTGQMDDIVRNADVIFVCVPTPMFENGECDISIVESVVKQVAELAEKMDKSPILIIKSTVPPGTTERLNNISKRVGVTFSPEFLTEKNAVEDFKNQNRIVLGIDYMEVVEPIKSIFDVSFPDADIIVINSKEAEMTKYTTNLFLATKVSFFNDIYTLCQHLKINYDNVIEATMHDPRIGKSHYMVPGHDGDRGYGGHCLPGNYEVTLPNSIKIKLSNLYGKFKAGEFIEVVSYDHNVENEEVKIVKDITKTKFSGELYKFTLDDGSQIECTTEHIFPVKRNGKLILVMAKDIVYTDDFFNMQEINNKKTLTSYANKIFR